MGPHFQFSDCLIWQLVEVLGQGSLQRLSFHCPEEYDHIIALGDAIATSRSNTLTDLYLYGSRRRFRYRYIDRCVLCTGFDEAFVQRLKRRLNINGERKSSEATFSKFSMMVQRTPDPNRRVGYAEVFAVRPAIAFEYLRSDECGLLKAIIDATEAVSKPSNDGRSTRMKRRRPA